MTTGWYKLYSQTVLDHFRAEHPCMSYSDRRLTVADLGTRLHSHHSPLPRDLTPVNVPHCLDLIYTPVRSVIKAPSCSIHRPSHNFSEVGTVAYRDWHPGSGLMWTYTHYTLSYEVTLGLCLFLTI